MAEDAHAYLMEAVRQMKDIVQNARSGLNEKHDVFKEMVNELKELESGHLNMSASQAGQILNEVRTVTSELNDAHQRLENLEKALHAIPHSDT